MIKQKQTKWYMTNQNRRKRAKEKMQEAHIDSDICSYTQESHENIISETVTYPQKKL